MKTKEVENKNVYKKNLISHLLESCDLIVLNVNKTATFFVQLQESNFNGFFFSMRFNSGAEYKVY